MGIFFRSMRPVSEVDELSERELRARVIFQQEEMAAAQATIQELRDELAETQRQVDTNLAIIEIKDGEIEELSTRHQRTLARLAAEIAVETKREVIASPE